MLLVVYTLSYHPEWQDDILPLLSSNLSCLPILVHSPQFTVLSVTCLVEGATVFLCLKGLRLLSSKLKHLLYIFGMFSGLKTFPFMLLFFTNIIFCNSFHCCYCSLAKSCLTLCDPMDCSSPGFSVLHYLPEFAQIHVH